MIFSKSTLELRCWKFKKKNSRANYAICDRKRHHHKMLPVGSKSHSYTATKSYWSCDFSITVRPISKMLTVDYSITSYRFHASDYRFFLLAPLEMLFTRCVTSHDENARRNASAHICSPPEVAGDITSATESSWARRTYSVAKFHGWSFNSFCTVHAHAHRC